MLWIFIPLKGNRLWLDPQAFLQCSSRHARTSVTRVTLRNFPLLLQSGMGLNQIYIGGQLHLQNSIAPTVHSTEFWRCCITWGLLLLGFPTLSIILRLASSLSEETERADVSNSPGMSTEADQIPEKFCFLSTRRLKKSGTRSFRVSLQAVSYVHPNVSFPSNVSRKRTWQDEHCPPYEPITRLWLFSAPYY
jgi:hypothetical protein